VGRQSELALQRCVHVAAVSEWLLHREALELGLQPPVTPQQPLAGALPLFGWSSLFVQACSAIYSREKRNRLSCVSKRVRRWRDV